MDARVLVVWNPGAGSTAQAAAIRVALESRSLCEVVETASRERAATVINEAIDAGCRRVVAAGGDGTANAVLQALADRGDPQVSMAVLPLGTGNDLARSLGMPTDPLEGLEIVLAGAAKPCDLFRCRWNKGSRVIANMCTAGNSGLYLQTLTPEMKQRWGPFCYLRGVLDVLADLKSFEVDFAWEDGSSETVSALNLFLAQGRMTGGGMQISPRAALDDGRIDVVIVREGAPLDLASLTADYLMSDFLQHPLVMYRQVTGLAVRGHGPLPVTIDGDTITSEPFEIRRDDASIAVVHTAESVGLSGDGEAGGSGSSAI